MIEQNTPEWFEARKNRVTGSSVGAILGLDPNRTRDDVMRAMVRESLGAEKEDQGEFVEDVIFGYGKNNENGAVFDFQLETGLSVEKCGFFPYEDWLGASPDGLTSDGGCLEVKSPWSRRPDAKKRLPFKALDEQPHYYAQCQIEAFCAGRTHTWFKQGTGRDDDPAAIKVELDQGWIDQNLPRLKQFHAEFLDELSNEDHLAPRRVVIDTPEAARMLREWDEIAEQLELLTERKKDLLVDIAALCKGKDGLVAGRKVTLVEKAGAISYAKAIKELLPKADLEKWRGKASHFWKVT